jgi:hypothetical protein
LFHFEKRGADPSNLKIRVDETRLKIENLRLNKLKIIFK